MKIKLPYQVVLLVRGEGCKIPLTVMQHEVDVLRSMHGEENVQETDIVPPIKEAEFDTADEYSRLEQYYHGDNDNKNPTRSVWRSLEDFETAFAPADGADKADLIEQAISLGIPAKATWGISKLQQAIAEAQVE